MPSYNLPQDIIDAIIDLGFRLAILEKTNPLNNGTIDSGGLVVKDPDSPSFIRLAASRLYLFPDTDPVQAGIIGLDSGTGYYGLRIIAPAGIGDNAGANALTITGRGGVGGAPGVNLYGDTIVIDALNTLFLSGAQTELGDGAAGTYSRLRGATIDLQPNSGGALRLFNLPTTTNTGNLFLNTGAQVFYGNTSERRFKLDIEPLEMELSSVLKLAELAVTWTDKAEREEDEKTPHRLVGWIAEDFEEDPWLNQFVEYNEMQDVKTITYDRVSAALAVGVAALHEELQESKATEAAQQEEIDELKAQTKKQQEQINAILAELTSLREPK